MREKPLSGSSLKISVGINTISRLSKHVSSASLEYLQVKTWLLMFDSMFMQPDIG